MRLFGVIIGATCLAHAVLAGPQGGQVQSGGAAISQVGKVTTINQSTPNAIIHWTKFESTSTETIRFQQPNGAAATLNRVTGSDPSFLGGTLTANGKVFILNPNGVVFGAGSSVNVGSLVASTLTITDADFNAGRVRLVQPDGRVELGAVVNLGTIRAAPGGRVALLAPIVDNSGIISAPQGRVVIVADTQAHLDHTDAFPGVAGATARSVRMPTVGFTRLLEDVVNTTSVASANKITRLSDGTVFLRKAGGVFVNGGTINADGETDTSRSFTGPGPRVDIQANRAIGLQSGSSISAVGAAAVESGPAVRLSANTKGIFQTRGGGTSSAHAVITSPRTDLETEGGPTSDQALFTPVPGTISNEDVGGLELRGTIAILDSGGDIGSLAKPIRINTERVIAGAPDSGGVFLLSDSSLTVDYIRAHDDVKITAREIHAGHGAGDPNDRLFLTPGGSIEILPPTPTVLPPPPPPPSFSPAAVPEVAIQPTYINILARSVTLDGLVVADPAVHPLSIQENVPTATTLGPIRGVAVPIIGSISSPELGATVAIDDFDPLPRTPYSPPVDALDAPAGPATAPTFGARDNVLTPTLRTTLVKGDRDSSTHDSTGGLIEVTSRGRKTDTDDESQTPPGQSEAPRLADGEHRRRRTR